MFRSTIVVPLKGLWAFSSLCGCLFFFKLTALKSDGNPDEGNDLIELEIKRDLLVS